MDKERLRERVWDDLEESGEARFPFPPHGRIPNFAGADDAAERLADTGAWRDADVIKANPDAPQLPVRRAALRQGKTVYMAVPRLRDEKCFLRLDPAEIEDIDHATTVGGSAEVGVQVGPDEMERVDLIVSGSVAVTADGERVGKGEGYSDLEFAVLWELGLVEETTPVATTVHERQLVEADVPTGDHDVPLDLIVTPGRTLRTGGGETPAGIDWALLSDERRAEIPVLSRFDPR
ncbi:5-formyltetrahydrofolate cyclo-ligase [Halorientalis persicus]|jgi:5-formyltetrahydrofolate cyclo-ligase|uniref:5-formyltetrahydrofolate cyclo-ligase n=1 Tax=Halorientalis persicus TaxID=1367881 RepID=A0A1H8CU55_9EURY|nr:5-formyltetrahydrofolate cyclo-ligase [Halorientalis persicus]SEM97677.1 5-formyltetrahydrofolate cyclo-ligase [Halorientalis persicus]